MDKAKAEARLNKVEQEPQKQSMPPVEVNVEAKKTTETVREEGAVQIADDLRNNKESRKMAEKDFQNALEKRALDKSDKDFQRTMTYSIARYKYNKKITKQMDKLNKEYKSTEEVLQKYFNEYASDEEKERFDIFKSKLGDDNLLEAYKMATGDQDATFDDVTGAAKKEKAPYLALSVSEPYYNKDAVLERMAIVDIMGTRSSKQIVKDREDFIKDEAKRQVKMAETNQNVKNTRLYFSKDDRKAAEDGSEDSALIHNDIGKFGRKLVSEFPDEFCDRVDSLSEADKDIEPITVTDPKTGLSKKVYFKFSQDKYNEFCSKICNTASSEDGFAQENNLTLNEGREAWKEQIYIDRNGNRRSLEQMVGDDDGRVGNRELNRLRHFIEKGGRSVDTNPTNTKRILSVLGGTAIGALSGGTLGALSSVAAGAIQTVASTAPQVINWNKTVGYTDYWEFTTPDKTVTATDYYYDASGVLTIDRDIKVPGETYNGTLSGTVNVSDSQVIDGQTVRAKANNHSKVAKAQALFGGIAGCAGSLANMHNIHAKGKHFDGAVTLTKPVTYTDTEDTTFKLNIPQSKTISVRSGQIATPDEEIGNKACKLRVKNKDRNTNIAEAKEDMVAVYYDIDKNSPEFQKVYKYVMEEINGLQKYGTFNYTKNTTYYLPDMIPASVFCRVIELIFYAVDRND